MYFICNYRVVQYSSRILRFMHQSLCTKSVWRYNRDRTKQKRIHFCTHWKMPHFSNAFLLKNDQGMWTPTPKRVPICTHTLILCPNWWDLSHNLMAQSVPWGWGRSGKCAFSPFLFRSAATTASVPISKGLFLPTCKGRATGNGKHGRVASSHRRPFTGALRARRRGGNLVPPSPVRLKPWSCF